MENAFKRWECSVAGDIVVSHQIEFAELGVKNAKSHGLNTKPNVLDVVARHLHNS